MADSNASSNGGQLPPGAVGQGAIVITGASTGIGAGCALRMDQRGYRVFAGVRREEDGERLRAMASDRLTPLMIDVTIQRSIDDAAAAVDAATGDHGLAGLVNNAGVAITGPVEYLSVDRYREQFEVNYFGQIAVTQAFLPAIRRAGGRIVTMGSIAGRASAPFLSPYAGTKHALEALTDSLRGELAPWGHQCRPHRARGDQDTDLGQGHRARRRGDGGDAGRGDQPLRAVYRARQGVRPRGERERLRGE